MTVRLIRSKSIQRYLIDTLLFGFILSFFSVLLLLIFSDFDIVNSIIRGFLVAVLCVFVIQIIRFIIKELVIRGTLIKKLNTEYLKVLRNYGIFLQDELVFKGVYRGYSINIYPREETVKKNIKLFFTINAYYNYPDSLTDDFLKWKFDQDNIKTYEVGSINFGSHVAILHPIDKYKPDFKSCIDFLIDKLNELKLTPMDFSEWEKLYIQPLEEKHKLERNQVFDLFKKQKK